MAAGQERLAWAIHVQSNHFSEHFDVLKNAVSLSKTLFRQAEKPYLVSQRQSEAEDIVVSEKVEKTEEKNEKSG